MILNVVDYTKNAVENLRVVLRVVECFQFNNIHQGEFQIGVEPGMDKTGHISFIEA